MRKLSSSACLQVSKGRLPVSAPDLRTIAVIKGQPELFWRPESGTASPEGTVLHPLPIQTHTEMLTLLRTLHGWDESLPVHHAQ